MVRHTLGITKYAPLILQSFSFFTPHHFLESEKFNIRYANPSEITEVADKLKWHRYTNSLLQKDVAHKVGINRSTYVHYEESGRDYYPIEIMQKLAILYGVDVTELLDEFNMFLYNGQGEQIRQKRQTLNMTQSEYAKMLGVPLGTLKQWERNRVHIFKSTWEKYFK